MPFPVFLGEFTKSSKHQVFLVLVLNPVWQIYAAPFNSFKKLEINALTDRQTNRQTDGKMNKNNLKKSNTLLVTLLPQIQTSVFIHTWKVSPRRIHCCRLLYTSPNIPIIIKIIINISSYINFNLRNFNLPVSILFFW